MFQKDDFTLSVLTGSQLCQFVLVKKELIKMNMWKFLSLLRSTYATWQMRLSYHNETYFTIGFYSQAEQIHHLQPLRLCKWGQSIISVKSVPVMLLEGKWERSSEKSRRTFPFTKEHKDDVQKDEKYGDLLKLGTNSVHSVKTIVLAYTRKSISISQVWTARWTLRLGLIFLCHHLRVSVSQHSL